MTRERDQLIGRVDMRKQAHRTHALGLHRTLSGMIEEILATDRIAIRALEAIVSERRAALQAAEQAANTLAAYARMSALPTTASLVNGRG